MRFYVFPIALRANRLPSIVFVYGRARSRLRARALREDLRSGAMALREGQTLKEMSAAGKKARNFRFDVLLRRLRAFTDDQDEGAACSAKRKARARSTGAKRVLCEARP